MENYRKNKFSSLKSFKKKIKLKGYIILYKVANVHWLLNEFEDELDFQVNIKK